MFNKGIHVFSISSAPLHLGTILFLLIGPVAHGQCPNVFNYQLDQTTNQLFGYVKLQNLSIGQLVKLTVYLSIDAALNQNNLGSIALVKSKDETILDVYNNQPAQYRINFPIGNVVPNLLAIRVNEQTICTGQKATGEMVKTIKLEHALSTQLESLLNDKGSSVKPPVIQTLRMQPQSTVAADALDGSAELCGLADASSLTLSINGVSSTQGQFPWAVPIFYKAASTKPTYLCGSTIISKYHLVTAGHCMYFNNVLFRASDLVTTPGMHNIDNFFERDIQLRKVASFTVHPDYSNDDYGTELDIALMVLEQAIIYNRLVRPICMWNGNDKVEDIVGLTGLVSGWGVTENGAANTPSYVNLTVVENHECRRNLGRIVVPYTFCADGHGAAPCRGDSGSGLVMRRGSRFYLRGIVSVGQFDTLTLLCDRTKYVVFTDIAPLRYWVLEKVVSKT